MIRLLHHASVKRIALTVGVAALLLVGLGLLAGPSLAQGSGTYMRYFKHEMDTGSMIWDVYNLSSITHTVTFHIYYANGVEWSGSPVSITLRPYEEKTLVPSKPPSDPTPGWNLPIVLEGTPATTTAYGIIASSDYPYSIIAWADNTDSGAGSAYTTINPQPELWDDTWWGMYNFDDDETCTKPPDKEDYFHVFNANPGTATVTMTVHASSGAVISTTVHTLGPYVTRKLYPQCQLGVPDPAGKDNTAQNIGIHLTSNVGVAVNVNTYLGDQWQFPNGPYSTHSSVAGEFVPWATDDYDTSYIWENSRASDKLAAARVTNIAAATATVTWTIYTYDGTGPVGGNSYQVVQTVPPYGTTELPMPPTNDFKNEPVSEPWFHSMLIESTQPLAPHVSFEENIDVPQSPSQGLTSFWYGCRDPSRTRQWMMLNPHPTSITVTCEAWYWTNGTLVYDSDDVEGLAGVFTMGPYDAFVLNPTDTTWGPGFDAQKDKVIHCYSDIYFGIQLQEPDYGDVTPLVGGGLKYTLGVELDSKASCPAPGMTITYPHTITNTGSWLDTYSLTVTSKLGWTTLLYGDPNCNGILEPSEVASGTIDETPPLEGTETYCFFVVVSVPEDAEDPDQDIATITGTSHIAATIYAVGTDTTDICIPTCVCLFDFRASVAYGGVALEWDTSPGADFIGFNLFRMDPRTKKFVQVNEDLILVLPDTVQGGTHRYLDVWARPGKTYMYQLVAVDLTGVQTVYGPFEVKAPLWLPLAKGGRGQP